MSTPQENADRLQRSSFDFLINDLHIALTFTKIGLDSGDDIDKRKRNQKNARHAYDTILRLKLKLELTQDEGAELDKKVEQLRTALQQLGEEV